MICRDTGHEVRQYYLLVCYSVYKVLALTATDVKLWNAKADMMKSQNVVLKAVKKSVAMKQHVLQDSGTDVYLTSSSQCHC